MNKILAMLNCLVFVFAFGGCGQQVQWGGKTGDGVFPEVMVGVWEAEVTRDSKWGIKFEPDGSILKVIHSLAGPVKLSEDGVYLEGPEPDTYAVFIMGPCEAKYYPETNELRVKIVLEHYEMKMPSGVLEGRIESYFSGPVSKDGKTWEVDWLNYAWLEGAVAPDPNIIEANPAKLIFSKLDLSQIKQKKDNVQ